MRGWIRKRQIKTFEEVFRCNRQLAADTLQERGIAMPSRLCTFFGLALFVVLHGTAAAAPFAYIGNIGETKVSVIDTATNSVVTTVPLPESVTGIAVNPAGTRVYAANSMHLYVIDTATNVVVATVKFGTGIGGYAGVAVHPAGTRVYVTSNWNESAIKVIDTQTNTEIATIPTWGSSMGLAVNPDGKRLYVANMYSGTIWVISTEFNLMADAIDLTVGNPCGGTPMPFGLAVNAAGTRVYVANQNCMGQDGYWYTSVIDAVTDTVIAHVASGTSPSPRGVAVSPDGARVYVSNGAVIDTATLTMIASFPGSSLNGIALNPDGTRAYLPILSFGSPGYVSVVDTTTNAIIATVNVGGTPFAFGEFVGPTTVAAGIWTAVEYHHASFDHYFITPLTRETALLDAHTPPFQEWSRTGYTFNVYEPATAPTGSVAICRFFNEHYWPKSSHFYAAQGFGCEATLAMFPDWGLEDDKLFNAMLPDGASGACPTGTTSVYRLYNNGMGNAPNHRFVTSFAERQNMINQGWVAEGAGIGVGMCVPQ
jgi:YVTN family beta-propeller protein